MLVAERMSRPVIKFLSWNFETSEALFIKLDYYPQQQLQRNELEIIRQDLAAHQQEKNSIEGRPMLFLQPKHILHVPKK